MGTVTDTAIDTPQSASNAHLASQAAQSAYRDYDKPGIERVRNFYRHNHTHQTYAFVQENKAKWLSFGQKKMTPWEGLDFLNTLIDDSDPDIELPQIMHLLQTAEAIRADGHPDWFVLTGFIHDLGKLLCLFGQPQWAVVGDTFPTGCKHSEKIVYSEFFSLNPDSTHPRYSTEYGVYAPHCGLDAVQLSWGHDEYLYHVLKPYLPEPALYMVRYHSFYAWHREGEYTHLSNAHDEAHKHWVQKFNPYDLYSKNPVPPVLAQVKPYYEDLLAKYLPAHLQF